MILAINKTQYCIGCRMSPILRGTNPRPGDFENLYFSINGTTYFEWDTAFEQALLIEKLTRD